MHAKSSSIPAYMALLEELSDYHEMAIYAFWQTEAPEPLLLVGEPNVDGSVTLTAAYYLLAQRPQLIAQARQGLAASQRRGLTAYEGGQILETWGSGQVWTANLFVVSPAGALERVKQAPYDIQSPEETLAALGLSSVSILDTSSLSSQSFA